MSDEEYFQSSSTSSASNGANSTIPSISVEEATKSQKDVITLQSVAELKTHGFIIGKKLNSGSFSRVHQAKHNNVDCAVKIINLGKATSNFIYKLLPREIVILKKLNHPHIILLHDIFLIQPNLYIFMELAEGGDLLDFIVAHGALSESKAKKWFRQVADALCYCHKLGVAHRDIKCENIIINRGSIKLTDFGFACIIYDTETRRKLMSTTYCGSISYVSPEILLNVPYDPTQSDIWSLGVVLYVMLNNQLPFESSSNLTDIVKNQINNNWSFEAGKAAIISEEAKLLVKSMLNPNPRTRLNITKVLESQWLTNHDDDADENDGFGMELSISSSRRRKRQKNNNISSSSSSDDDDNGQASGGHKSGSGKSESGSGAGNKRKVNTSDNVENSLDRSQSSNELFRGRVAKKKRQQKRTNRHKRMIDDQKTNASDSDNGKNKNKKQRKNSVAIVRKRKRIETFGQNRNRTRGPESSDKDKPTAPAGRRLNRTSRTSFAFNRHPTNSESRLSTEDQSVSSSSSEQQQNNNDQHDDAARRLPREETKPFLTALPPSTDSSAVSQESRSEESADSADAESCNSTNN